ncbi:hypothetical protein WAI453_002041 [Rhynchosporium graminicola]
MQASTLINLFFCGKKRTGLKGEASAMVSESFNVVCENWLEVCTLAKRGSLDASDSEVEAGYIRSHNTDEAMICTTSNEITNNGVACKSAPKDA